MTFEQVLGPFKPSNRKNGYIMVFRDYITQCDCEQILVFRKILEIRKATKWSLEIRKAFK